MPLPNYSRVRLITNRYESEGISSGDIGYIIEVYEELAYEIEFSKEDGTTIAQIVVPQVEVELAESEP